MATKKKKSQRHNGRSNSSTTSSSLSTKEIEFIVDRLKGQRVRSITKQNYYSVWKKFNEFFISLDRKPTNWEERLILFVGYIIEIEKLQSQTVRSYISAIRNVLQENGIDISMNTFVLTSLTKACKLQNDCVKIRMPIKKALLTELLKFTENYFMERGQYYLALLYKALFSSSYYGLFRVSEVTETISGHAVRVTDVQIGENKKKFLFILRSLKTHGKHSHPQLIHISSPKAGKDQTTSSFCPFGILNSYIAIRPDYSSNKEQFFVFRDLTPVTANHFCNTLKEMLRLMRYDYTLYLCHSFRTGHSCDLLRYGVPIKVIQKLGRWKTNAVFAYLRTYT